MGLSHQIAHADKLMGRSPGRWYIRASFGTPDAAGWSGGPLTAPGSDGPPEAFRTWGAGVAETRSVSFVRVDLNRAWNRKRPPQRLRRGPWGPWSICDVGSRPRQIPRGRGALRVCGAGTAGLRSAARWTGSARRRCASVGRVGFLAVDRELIAIPGLPAGQPGLGGGAGSGVVDFCAGEVSKVEG